MSSIIPLGNSHFYLTPLDDIGCLFCGCLVLMLLFKCIWQHPSLYSCNTLKIL